MIAPTRARGRVIQLAPRRRRRRWLTMHGYAVGLALGLALLAFVLTMIWLALKLGER